MPAVSALRSTSKAVVEDPRAGHYNCRMTIGSVTGKPLGTTQALNSAAMSPQAWTQNMAKGLVASVNSAIQRLEAGQFNRVALSDLKQFAYELPYEVDTKGAGDLASYVGRMQHSANEPMATPAQAISILKTVAKAVSADFSQLVGESKNVKVMSQWVDDAMSAALTTARTTSTFEPNVASAASFSSVSTALAGDEAVKNGRRWWVQGKFGLVEITRTAQPGEYTRKHLTITPPNGQTRELAADERRALRNEIQAAINQSPALEDRFLSVYNVLQEG